MCDGPCRARRRQWERRDYDPINVRTTTERGGSCALSDESWSVAPVKAAGWTRFGALPGYIAGNFGAFGGRWISADRLDPSRLCMYVPAGRYKALHLIAVAADRKDSVPLVSAQFYRPDAGHPAGRHQPRLRAGIRAAGLTAQPGPAGARIIFATPLTTGARRSDSSAVTPPAGTPGR